MIEANSGKQSNTPKKINPIVYYTVNPETRPRRVGPITVGEEPTGYQKVRITYDNYQGGLWYQIPGSSYKYPVTKDMAREGFVVKSIPEIFSDNPNVTVEKK